MQPDKRTDTTARDAIANSLKDRSSVHIGSGRQVKDVAFKRVRNAFRSIFGAFGAKTPTQNELTLSSDLFAIKRKLGKSFFTKQLTPGTRKKRIGTLTSVERRLARAKGWTR